MNGAFEWEDELNELMQSYSTELPSLMAQMATDRAVAEAEARAANSAGINLRHRIPELRSQRLQASRTSPDKNSSEFVPLACNSAIPEVFP